MIFFQSENDKKLSDRSYIQIWDIWSANIYPEAIHKYLYQT